MLVEANRNGKESVAPSRPDMIEAATAGTTELLAAAWRQKYVIALSILVFLLLGVAYLVQAVPRYTGSTTILIDSRKVGAVGISALESALTFDSGVVDSQVQILQSDKLAGMVVDRLGLAGNDGFLSPPQSVVGAAVSGVVDTATKAMSRLFSLDKAPDLADLPPVIRRQLAIEQLKANVKVNRVARSYVMTVDYVDADRQLARDIAAAYGQAYLTDQIDSRVEIARNASVWMEIRSLKVALDVRTNLRRPAVVGFLSLLPDEGKSTTAKNFASLVAAQGERVLLVDGDLRNPHLTRSLAPDARHGIIELLRKSQTLEDVVYVEDKSALAFLPGATHKRFDASGDLLGSQAMAGLVREAAAKYDVVVVDLPPAGVLVDAAAAAQIIDYYFLVVEWGKTRRDVVRDMLVAEPALADKIIGVALSKVDLDKLKAFGVYGAYGYAGGYGNRYYGKHG